MSGIIQTIFSNARFNEMFYILIHISVKFVSKGFFCQSVIIDSCIRMVPGRQHAIAWTKERQFLCRQLASQYVKLLKGSSWSVHILYDTRETSNPFGDTDPAIIAL